MAFQATSGSQREKWVAAFIPAVAILMISFFYFTFFANPELKKVESKFNSAVSGTVTPDVIAKLEWDAKQLRKDRTELKGVISAVNEEVAAKSGAFQKLSPTAKHSAVTELCREHGVAILKDQTVNEIRLPSLRRKSVETLTSLVPRDAIGFRELTVTADYATIVVLLKKLPEVSGVIPVSVKLEKGKVADSLGGSRGPPVSWTVGLLM